MLEWNVVPSSGKLSHVVPVFKHGNASDPDQYRPIALASCAFNFFERLVHSRIAPRALQWSRLVPWRLSMESRCLHIRLGGHVAASAQLQTVLALYDREMNRDRVSPSYPRLRTMVRHIDQTIRTRNFKARNERIETRVLVKSHKEKVSVERKVGEYFQWRATRQCSKGDSCSFSHESWSRGTIILFCSESADTD